MRRQIQSADADKNRLSPVVNQVDVNYLQDKEAIVEGKSLAIKQVLDPSLHTKDISQFSTLQEDKGTLRKLSNEMIIYSKKVQTLMLKIAKIEKNIRICNTAIRVREETLQDISPQEQQDSERQNDFDDNRDDLMMLGADFQPLEKKDEKLQRLFYRKNELVNLKDKTTRDMHYAREEFHAKKEKYEQLKLSIEVYESMTLRQQKIYDLSRHIQKLQEEMTEDKVYTDFDISEETHKEMKLQHTISALQLDLFLLKRAEAEEKTEHDMQQQKDAEKMKIKKQATQAEITGFTSGEEFTHSYRKFPFQQAVNVIIGGYLIMDVRKNKKGDLVLISADSKETILQGNTITMGRDKANDIVFSGDHGDISRKHISITVDDHDMITIFDTSTNGTIVCDMKQKQKSKEVLENKRNSGAQKLEITIGSQVNVWFDPPRKRGEGEYRKVTVQGFNKERTHILVKLSDGKIRQIPKKNWNSRLEK